MAPATARGDVALVGRRALAQDADGRRRRRHGKIGENAPWLQNIIITAAAGSTDRRAGGPPRADGPERGRACSRAATEVARKTQRNDGQAWHSAGGETERERDHAPLDIVGKKKFPPPAASLTAPPPLFPSASFRPLPLRLVLRRRRRPAPQKKEKSTNLPEWTLSSAARARP